MDSSTASGRLDGRSAVVTGASRGIGLATAERLMALGARVATIQRGDGPGLSVSADLSDPVNAEAAVEEALGRLGGAEICVHAAGVTVREPLVDVSLADFQWVLAVNLVAGFAVTRAVAKHLMQRGAPGAIAHVSSILATFGGSGVGPYSASKGGVVQLMRSQSNEWAPHGIRVNAVAPGWIETSFNASLRADPARLESINSRIPAGRWGTSEDVAEAIAWLVGPHAAYVTGTVLTVDGGYAVR